MEKIPFYIVDAFTETPFQGNPAGVVFPETPLTAGQMRRLAGEIGLESAFVTRAASHSGADFSLRYFTAATEVPFCGHDTVATAVTLVLTGRASVGTEIRFATPVGIVPVTTARDAAGAVTATLHQTPQEIGPALVGAALAEVAGALGCAAEDLAPGGLKARRVSTGTPWLIVPARDKAAVDRAPGSFPAILALSERYATFGIYLFAAEGESEEGGYGVWSRCFAPIAGLNEDPVTGSATGALGWYLAEAGALPATERARFSTRQGFAGGRGGRASGLVQRAEGRVTRILVTGAAVLVAEGAFTALPAD